LASRLGLGLVGLEKKKSCQTQNQAEKLETQNHQADNFFTTKIASELFAGKLDKQKQI
jgi:hypothetical protein